MPFETTGPAIAGSGGAPPNSPIAHVLVPGRFVAVLQHVCGLLHVNSVGNATSGFCSRRQY